MGTRAKIAQKVVFSTKTWHRNGLQDHIFQNMQIYVLNGNSKRAEQLNSQVVTPGGFCSYAQGM